ncbi:MAG TPA: hypothetical protein VIA62_17330 [Thermoanaerobaculia bacterium]|jgi:hypothetical protein|nr:hypothetical protein [Thermoanaerobaculia bacterium]
MTRYPLLFGFNDLIASNGFFAGVSISGRALMWMKVTVFGLWRQSGGISAGGRTPGEAQSEFRLLYRTVLFDAASEAKDFTSFNAEVGRFFEETNNPTAIEWEEAVLEVRKGNIEVDWLPKRSAESRIGMTVNLIEHAVPSVNALDEAELAA